MNKKTYALAILIVLLAALALFKLSSDSEYSEYLNPLVEIKNDLVQCPKINDTNCVDQCANMTKFEEIAELANIYAKAKIHIDEYYKRNPLEPKGYYNPSDPSSDLLADALVYVADPEYFIKTNRIGMKNVEKFLELLAEQKKNYQAAKFVRDPKVKGTDSSNLSPAPDSPASDSPAPDSPASDSPAPESPASDSPAPESSAAVEPPKSLDDQGKVESLEVPVESTDVTSGSTLESESN